MQVFSTEKCFFHYSTTSWSLSKFFTASCAFLLEKAMEPHSSTIAWKIPWLEEPGRLQSLGSLGVGHDWVTSLSLFTFMWPLGTPLGLVHWKRASSPVEAGTAGYL